MHRLDDRARFFFGWWEGGLGPSVVWGAIVGLDRGIFVRYRVFWRGDLVGLLG